MVDLTRRGLIAALGALATTPLYGQGIWPTRSIALIHGFPAGGPVDTVARLLAEALSRRLEQQVIVDAKPGAAGTTAAAQVARAAPDGYTLLAVPATHAGTAAMYRTLPYKPVDDFSLVSTTVEYPFVLVTHSGHAIQSMEDLLKRASSSGRPLLYGTAGIGTLQHLCMELLATRARIILQHVPYRGGAPAITDLLGKRLDLVLDPPTALIPHIEEGALRPLAVTSEARFFALPAVPAIAESGFPGYNVSAIQGLAGPSGMPAAIIERLNREIAAVLMDQQIVDRLRKLGNNPHSSAPDQFKARLTSDIAQWTKVISDANIERI
jgi:tripartite-type tricarboxylate transporter receptor subunit TctC